MFGLHGQIRAEEGYLPRKKTRSEGILLWVGPRLDEQAQGAIATQADRKLGAMMTTESQLFESPGRKAGTEQSLSGSLKPRD